MAELILDYYRLRNEPYEDYGSLLKKGAEKYWYPFEKGAAVLCVNTDSLQALSACDIEITAVERSFFKAQMFREALNLTVRVGELCDIPLQGTFDYIVADDPDGGELEILRDYLKPEGKLLVSSGAANAEIEQQLKSLGFGYHRFYYLLPGGGVFHEGRLPALEEYLSAVCGEEVTEEEYRRARAIFEGNAFSHFAPVKLVEAGRRDNLAEPVWRPAAADPGRLVLPVDQDEELIARVQEVQLSLLRELKRVCDRNGLKVFLFYGSLLGAVRHGGYIPGDDDIDVALLRSDYDRLLSLADQFPDTVFLQTPENDDCFYGGYAKLRDTKTTAIVPQNWWKNCCEGICLDIFPLDRICSSPGLEKRKRREILFLQRLLYAKAYGYFDRFLDMPLLPWKFYKYVGKLFSREELAGRLNRKMTEHNAADGKTLGTYARYLGFGHGVTEYPAVDYEHPVRLTFEGLELDAPNRYLSVLKTLYGEEYLQPLKWTSTKPGTGFTVSPIRRSITRRGFPAC